MKSGAKTDDGPVEPNVKKTDSKYEYSNAFAMRRVDGFWSLSVVAARLL